MLNALTKKEKISERCVRDNTIETDMFVLCCLREETKALSWCTVRNRVEEGESIEKRQDANRKETEK